MSAAAKKRLVDALVSLAKTSRGGYDTQGSAISGGRKRRPRRSAGSLGVTNIHAGALSGGGLSGGRRTRRPRKTAGSLGVTNITSGAGLSGGRRTRKASGTSGGARKRRTGGSKWIDFVKEYQQKHNLSYADALAQASGPYKAKYGRKRTTRKK